MRNLKKQFGEQLRNLRKRKGMTQEQFAEEALISIDFLSLLERGINAPSFDTLERLALALDVPIKQLFEFDSDLHLSRTSNHVGD